MHKAVLAFQIRDPKPTNALKSPSCGHSLDLKRFHISSVRNCGLVLKLERFSYLSDRSFGLALLLYLVPMIGAFIKSRYVTR